MSKQFVKMFKHPSLMKLGFRVFRWQYRVGCEFLNAENKWVNSWVTRETRKEAREFKRACEAGKLWPYTPERHRNWYIDRKLIQVDWEGYE